MSEVSCKVFTTVVEHLRSSGLPLEPVVDGLPISVEDLRQPSNRIRWDDFTVVLENTARLVGSPERLEEIVHDDKNLMGILSALASNLLSVRSIYFIGAKWYGPSLFPMTRATCEDLPQGRVRQIVEIPPPYRDSELFFRVVRGALRSVPSMLGQPDALVEMELHPRRAIYTITPPRRLSLLERLRRRYSGGATIHKALDELLVQNIEIQNSSDRLRAANDQLAEKSHRLETLNRLGRQLARHVEVSRLAESVMKLLGGEFHFTGAALFLVPPGDGELEVIGRNGESAGEPSRQHLLRIAGDTVGRLDLWEPKAPDGSPDGELLQALLPWIALALNNARSFQSLTWQTQRLEEETAGRKRAEEQLQHVQKMEALGTLAGGLAHDFNNLLTAIRTYAELACERVAENGAARRNLHEIIGATDRGAGLIKQILAFSRRQALLPRRLDLNSMILGMATMLRRMIGEDIELVLLPAENLGLVMADPARIEQAIVNLVVNSRDAMPEGGRITIETSNVGAADSGPDATGPRYVKVEVRDTGVGMNRDTKSRIFEPFFTTKPRGEGTGLGLSTVHGTITQSGGTIAVQSEPGRGTSVSIRLPRVPGEVAARRRDEAEKEPPGGQETLLLVEDEEQVRTALRRVLEEKGYKVLEAPDGRQALSICESHEGPIELLLTDLAMPGIDGRELKDRVAGLRPEVRGVVYISGYASEEMGNAPLPPGQVFLAKPFTRPALLNTIRHLLDSYVDNTI